MKSKYAIISLVAIAAVLLSSTAIVGAPAEAKSKVKVYIKDITKNEFVKEKAKICIADDDDCFGKTKTIDMKKATDNFKKSKILAGTFTLKGFPNPDPEAEFGVGDVSACGRIVIQEFTANDCAYGNLKKDGKNKFKATIDYDDMVENFAEASN